MIHPRKREFLTLAKQTGWSQAELARKLEVTPGGMSGLIKGGTIPSAGLLKLLRLVVFTEQPGVLESAAGRAAALPPEPKDLALDGLLSILAGLGPKDRGELVAQFTGIARVVTRRRASSSAGATASRALRGAASASAGAAAVGSSTRGQARPASEAGSPSASASGKKRVAPRRRVAKESAPVPGPK